VPVADLCHPGLSRVQGASTPLGGTSGDARTGAISTTRPTGCCSRCPPIPCPARNDHRVERARVPVD